MENINPLKGDNMTLNIPYVRYKSGFCSQFQNIIWHFLNHANAF